MNEHKHPFAIIFQAKNFLASAGIYSEKWSEYLNTYQPPAELKYLLTIIELEGLEEIEALRSLNYKPGAKVKLGTDYPVFYAIKKLNNHSWSNNIAKQRAIEIYKATFTCNSRLEDDIDPSIYYGDAYSTRDILLSIESDNFLNSKSLSNSSLFQISLIEYYQTKFLKMYDQDTAYTRKLVKFLELMSGEREAGVRKNKQFEKKLSNLDILTIPAEQTSEDGTNIEISYPPAESNQHKTLCRISPKGGSKLTASDDRMAMRGRLNQQSSRNIISLMDMNRLTVQTISDYLKYLWPNYKIENVYNLLLFCTGINPERLKNLKVESRGRLKSASGCHFDKTSNIFSYDVLNQPKSKIVIELTLSELMVKIFALDKHPFYHSLEKSRKLAKQFHLHHPSQAPTPNRMCASSVLHFSRETFNEIETSYLAGDIPANFRAQSHYYPVDTEVINNKFQLCLQHFAHQFGFKTSKVPITVESNALNNIGSAYALPLQQLKKTISEIYSTTVLKKQEYKYINGINRIEHFIDLINLQHLQLFIIEQLSFCARRFGAKTSYANTTAFNKAWGSEKASPIFAIERKYIPTIALLNLQLEACKETIQKLNEVAFNYRITSHFKFDTQVNLLPVMLSFDTQTHQIKSTQLSGKKFYEFLNKYNFTNFSDGIPERVNPFKHTIAASLIEKVPQVLLDELMNHDRDGLDFCAPWSTGSAQSMELLVSKIDELFSELNIQVIRFTGEKHD